MQTIVQRDSFLKSQTMILCTNIANKNFQAAYLKQKVYEQNNDINVTCVKKHEKKSSNYQIRFYGKTQA